jgi:hypothetical protein
LRTNAIGKLLALFVLLLISKDSHAKDFRVEDAFAGYSLLHGDLQKDASGWEVSGGHYLQQWLSLHADFDAHHQSSAGSQRHQHDFLFGPQFSHRTDHFTLFAHALSGVTHVSGSLGKETGFGTVAGGGIDYDASPVIAIRLVQVDYHTAHLFGTFQNDARSSFGVVFRLIGIADPPPLLPPPPDRRPIARSSPR